jgi:hypothetical protein
MGVKDSVASFITNQASPYDYSVIQRSVFLAVRLIISEPRQQSGST